MSKYEKLDLHGIKTYSINERHSKVSVSDFAKPLGDSPSFKSFMDSLPKLLNGADFLQFINSYMNAIQKNAHITCMMGAHVIKVGLSPVLIDAMKRGWITHLALNGAGVIHDIEIAIWGKTSEDVAKGITDGSFGMAEESTRFINEAVSAGKGKMGYGESVSRALVDHGGPNLDQSLVYNALKAEIPLTVHSALGTEIIHQHSSLDGAAVGDTSWSDFQIFCKQISLLDKDSIVMNIGSAVIMPEVFLKALTVSRNLGHKTYGFTTATFDMIRHYRPLVNVVQRPTQNDGKGYYFLGHHELMIPLLFAALNSQNT
jgi:hypothetical protein